MRTAAGEAVKMVIELCSRISRREKWRIKAFLVGMGALSIFQYVQKLIVLPQDLLSYVPTQFIVRMYFCMR